MVSPKGVSLMSDCCPKCRSTKVKHYGLVFAYESTSFLEEVNEIDDEPQEGDFFACHKCGCTFVVIRDGDSK